MVIANRGATRHEATLSFLHRLGRPICFRLGIPAENEEGAAPSRFSSYFWSSARNLETVGIEAQLLVEGMRMFAGRQVRACRLSSIASLANGLFPLEPFALARFLSPHALRRIVGRRPGKVCCDTPCAIWEPRLWKEKPR